LGILKKRKQDPRHETLANARRPVREDAKVGAGTGSKLTLELTNDHKIIATQLELLRASFRQLDGDDSSDGLFLFNRLGQLLREHFRKEQRLLYPLLSHYLGSSICETLSAEHAEIMKVVHVSVEGPTTLEEPAKQLDQLLRAHISTEENVLFWYIDVRSPATNTEPRDVL